MKTYFDIVVVIPVGPDSQPGFINDTIHSFIYYTHSSYKIIISDDSQKNISSQIKEKFPDVDVLHTRKQMGSMCGLYISLSHAYAYALQKYDFRLLFKVDTDALIIGDYPEKEALKMFQQNDKTGMAGQYPLDYDGKTWDLKWPKDRITNGTMSWKFIRRPIGNYLLRKLHKKAVANGYHTGESVFGGAYFISYDLLQALKENGLLPNYNMANLNLGEDHLFSLLAKAEGFELGDLAKPGLPFALAWKGLPASPEQLKTEGKKIIHSVRNWQHMNESDIRAYYRPQRISQTFYIPEEPIVKYSEING